jgi:hypothetical protein
MNSEVVWPSWPMPRRPKIIETTLQKNLIFFQVTFFLFFLKRLFLVFIFPLALRWPILCVPGLPCSAALAGEVLPMGAWLDSRQRALVGSCSSRAPPASLMPPFSPRKACRTRTSPRSPGGLPLCLPHSAAQLSELESAPTYYAPDFTRDGAPWKRGRSSRRPGSAVGDLSSPLVALLPGACVSLGLRVSVNLAQFTWIWRQW